MIDSIDSWGRFEDRLANYSTAHGMSLECSQEPINTLPPPAKSSAPQEVRHAHRKEVLLHLGNVLGMGRLQNHLLANGRG